MKEKRPIKILKPCKIIRQKKETCEDATESMRFLSHVVQVGEVTDIQSNLIEQPSDFLQNPQKIMNQMLRVQDSLGVDDKSGRRMYGMVYELSKDKYELTNDEAKMIAGKIIDKYPNFQSVSVVSETEDSFMIGIAFNNYSAYGEKMTKAFRPYVASNAYNRLQREQEKIDDGQT